jgi:hypothetical protein
MPRSIRRRARRAAATLIHGYVLDGVDLIIVEGDFWTARQGEACISRLTTGVDPPVLGT